MSSSRARRGRPACRDAARTTTGHPRPEHRRLQEVLRVRGIARSAAVLPCCPLAEPEAHRAGAISESPLRTARIGTNTRSGCGCSWAPPELCSGHGIAKAVAAVAARPRGLPWAPAIEVDVPRRTLALAVLAAQWSGRPRMCRGHCELAGRRAGQPQASRDRIHACH
jgi:hypothetical protein